MKRSHWRKLHLGIYKGLTGLNFMPFKHIFGAQIKNNMLQNHVHEREMVLLFSSLFLRCCNKWGDFSSVPDYSTKPKKTTSCVITPCIYCFCFAGTSASGYREGSSKASDLVWKPAQFKCCCSCYLLPLTHAHARDKSDNRLALTSNLLTSKTWRD